MTRSNARELTVHLLYEMDHTGDLPEEAIAVRLDDELYQSLAKENEVYAERPSRKQLDYIRNCLAGVMVHQQELDKAISDNSVGWALHRISRLTKSALRLAIYEILYLEDVPTAVAINECLEITRKYEDESVVSFVNGVLGSFVRSHVEAEQ